MNLAFTPAGGAPPNEFFIKVYASLYTGEKAGLPRAVRDMFLQLGFFSEQGVVVLPWGMSAAHGVQRLLGGSLADAKLFLRVTTNPLHAGDAPMVLLEEDEGLRTLSIVSWPTYMGKLDERRAERGMRSRPEVEERRRTLTAARVRRYRERQQNRPQSTDELAGETSSVTHVTLDVTLPVTQAVTPCNALQKDKEKEIKSNPLPCVTCVTGESVTGGGSVTDAERFEPSESVAPLDSETTPSDALAPVSEAPESETRLTPPNDPAQAPQAPLTVTSPEVFDACEFVVPSTVETVKQHGCTTVSSRSERATVARILGTHCDGKRGSQLLELFAGLLREWLEAAPDGLQYGMGSFERWLNAGKPVSRELRKAVPPPRDEEMDEWEAEYMREHGLLPKQAS